MALIEQIAVADLMALGDFLTRPDDLALARRAQEPVGLDDGPSSTLRPGAGDALVGALAPPAPPIALPRSGRNARAGASAPTCSPYGSSPASSTATACVGACSRVSGPTPPIPSTNSSSSRSPTTTAPRPRCRLPRGCAAPAPVQRDMEHGRNEVRVMTVHGAKARGADRSSCHVLHVRCGPPWCSSRAARLRSTEQPFVWPVKGPRVAWWRRRAPRTPGRNGASATGCSTSP